MSAPLTRADVLRIATLARLELTGAEVELFTAQLTAVLAYADQVQQVDTTGVPPTASMLASIDAWREDMVTPSLTRADALANAPDATSDAGLFRVPKVL
jgi:aspartyl-tRNA(Asn)/glutamyl-tRNA(Gln) amidotransferase subunit C